MNAIDASCDNRRDMAGHIMARPVAEAVRRNSRHHEGVQVPKILQ
jgi:hypothetical protein